MLRLSSLVCFSGQVSNAVRSVLLSSEEVYYITLSPPLSPTISLPHSLSLSFSFSLLPLLFPPSLSLTLSIPLSLPFSPSLSLPPSFTSLSFSISFVHSFSLSLSHPTFTLRQYLQSFLSRLHTSECLLISGNWRPVGQPSQTALVFYE